MMITLEVEEDRESTTGRGLMDGARVFNRKRPPDVNRDTAAVRDKTGALLGGEMGRIAADPVYADVMWTGDKVRGSGRQMMVMLGGEVRERGAAEIWLYIVRFQAKPLYEKLGYSQFDEPRWDGERHARHFMRKDIV